MLKEKQIVCVLTDNAKEKKKLSPIVHHECFPFLNLHLCRLYLIKILHPKETFQTQIYFDSLSVEPPGLLPKADMEQPSRNLGHKLPSLPSLHSKVHLTSSLASLRFLCEFCLLECLTEWLRTALKPTASMYFWKN